MGAFGAGSFPKPGDVIKTVGPSENPYELSAGLAKGPSAFISPFFYVVSRRYHTFAALGYNKNRPKSIQKEESNSGRKQHTANNPR